VECGAALSPASVVVHHGRLYCGKHGFVFAHGCEYCKSLIAGSGVPHLLWNNKLYHLECFVCRVCGVKLTAADAKRFHNRPHCARCHRLRIADTDPAGDAPDTSRKHNPSAARLRRAGLRERGIPISSTPQYQTTEPVVEMAEKPMDAHKFEPKLK
jgi:hypothetical protein